MKRTTNYILYLSLLFGGWAISFAQFQGGNSSSASDGKVNSIICSATGVNPFAGGVASGDQHIYRIASTCTIVAVNPFKGGNNGGDNDTKKINTSCYPLSMNPFGGGANSGDAHSNIINTVCSIVSVNPFAGGNDDGFNDKKILPTNCMLLAVNPFSGSSHDGHDDRKLINATCSMITVNPFTGGNHDGHADISLKPSTCSSISVNPFSGGTNDGHSDGQILPYNPVNCSVPTPIELWYWKGSCHEGKITANWGTLTEIQNDYFTLELSENGSQFSPMALIDGQLNSNQSTQYSKTFETTILGKQFLRLKQTNADQTFTYSNVIPVDCNQSVTQFFPNPANNILTIQLSEKDIGISLLDLNGQVIWEGITYSTTTFLDVKNIKNGTYVLRIKKSEKEENHLIVIQK